MITCSLNTVTKLLLIIAPLIIVSGCTTVADPGNPSSQAAAKIQAEPTPDRLVRYCRRMAETKNLRIAVGICERALAAAPENPEPVLILAEAYLEAERRAEAAEAYRFALSIDSESGKAHFGLGKLYLRDARLEEARPHLEAALRNGEQDPAIFNALGVLEDQSGNHAAAQTFYQTGLALDPDNTALANNYGVSILLSKPTQIGKSSFSQSLPEQDLTTKTSPADPVAQGTVAFIAPEKKTTAPRKAHRLADSGDKRAVAPTASVPALVQTHDETLFSFFTNSRSTAPTMTDPVITPAPVEIVDFQALPVPPALAVAQETVNAGSRTDLARALLDYSPTQASGQARPKLDAVLVSREAPQAEITRAPSFDLATVNPIRNPFIAPKTYTAFNEKAQSIPSETVPELSLPNMLVAEIHHLPIEMPEFNDKTQSENRGKPAPSGDMPEANRAAIPLETETPIFDAGSPLQSLTTTEVDVAHDLITDGDSLPGIIGLSLLQQNNDVVWDSLSPATDREKQLTLHHDGRLAPTLSDFEGDAEPRSEEPADEPLTWPNSLADINVPLNNLPPDDAPSKNVLAMMLLSRNALSTA